MDTDPNSTQQDYIPKKKNVVFEAAKGFTSFIGADVVFLAAISSISNSWKAKTLKSYDAEYIAKAFNNGWSLFFPACSAIESAAKAIEHNKHVDELTKRKSDSHMQRYEQAKLANSETSQGQNR